MGTTNKLSFTIMGVPRSGTTALVRAANLHPRVFCTNEWRLALRATDPWFALPDILLEPERFSFQPRLLPDEAGALKARLASPDPLVFGDKWPRYFMVFDQVKAAAPAARHAALYRSPYAFSMSWDARARNEKDETWQRGRIGLFSILEWFVFLDCVSTFREDIRLLRFEDLYFSSSRLFGEWFNWATGLPSDRQLLSEFETHLLDQLPPDAARSADCPYADLLDDIGAREVDALVARAAWQDTAALATPLREFVEARAGRAVEGIVGRLAGAGEVVLDHGRKQTAHALKTYRELANPTPVLLAALEQLATRLGPAAPERKAREKTSQATPAIPPGILRRDIRRLLHTRVKPEEYDQSLTRMAPADQRRALYTAFDFCFIGNAPAELLERLDRIMSVIPSAVSERERIIRRYLAEGDLALAEEMREVARRTVDIHALSWAIFLAAHHRFRRHGARKTRPGRIVQFWDAAPPPDIAAAMADWREQVGEANHVCYNEETGRELMHDVAGLEGRRAYDACWHAAMRSDLVRLAALLKGGGLWLDADTAPLPSGSIPELGAELHLSFTVRDPAPRFSNDIMSAAPGHPLLAEILERCLHNVLVKRIEAPNNATGPYVLTEVIRARGLDGDSTAISLAEARATVAQDWRPAYKAERTDTRSWQVALRQRQGA